MSRLRLTVNVLIATCLLAGCGQDTTAGGDPGPASTPAVSPAASQIPLPPGFLASFPPPPQDTSVDYTELTEGPTIGVDPGEETGRALSLRVAYPYGTGSAADVEAVLDHYRRLLPGAGWTILQEEPLDDEASSSNPGARLELQGHDYWRTQLLVAAEDGPVDIQVLVTERHADRRLYADHPPLIAMPDWFAALPPSPEGNRRFQIRTTNGRSGQSYWIDFSDDAGIHEGRPAELIDHYRDALPGAGWSILGHEDTTEDVEVQHGTIQRRQATVHIEAHGVTGAIGAIQETNITGAWQPARLSVAIDHPTGT